MTSAAGLTLECDSLSDSPAALAPDFEALEPFGDCPYLTYGWLRSWAAAYGPRQLRSVRVIAPERGVVALGVLEELRFRRLRFAGAPVSPVRSLLCMPGYDEAAWDALLSWASTGRHGWPWLEASGVPPVRDSPPTVVLSPLAWLSMELPATFGQYLESRPSRVRSNLRRRLRIADREGVRTVRAEAGAARGALDHFVRLHQARAADKREAHPNIDDRLAALLDGLVGAPQPKLKVTTLELEGQTIAVGVALEHAGNEWFYNFGFDPDAARLTPGVVLRLASIRDAIERGSTRCDFGPGDARYKRDLGAEPVERARVEATSRSAAGHVQRAAALSRRRLREIEWLREVRKRVHRLRAGAQTSSARS